MVSFGRRKAAQEPKHPADPLVTRAADPTEPVAAVGLSVEELWDRALSQLEDGEPVERIPLDEQRRVEIIASDSQFLAARVLDLESLPGPIGPHGALLALPHRHMVMVHMIEDAPTLPRRSLRRPRSSSSSRRSPLPDA